MPNTQGNFILVVDDEEAIRHVTEIILESAGFSVLNAWSGRESIRLVSKRMHEIGAILLDMTMPDMPGEAVLRKVKSISPDTPIVLMSGYDREEICARVGGNGFGFLQKPFKAQDLVRQMEMAIARPESNRDYIAG